MRGWPSLARWGLCGLLAGCGPGAPGTSPATGQDAELRVVGPQLESQRWLAEPSRVARQAGAGPLRPIAAALVAEGDRVGGFVDLPEQDCLLGLARSSAGVSDVDLFAFSDGGDVLASDEAPTADATVLICPPHPRRLYLAARLMAGRGVLAVGAQRVPAGAAAAVARALQVRGRPGEDTGRLAAWPGLEAKIRQRHGRLGSAWQDLRRAVLPVAPRSIAALSVPLEGGRCIDVLATPAKSVLHFDLWALDPAGRIVARAAAEGRDRGLLLCSQQTRTITLQMQPRVSTGLVAVVVAQSARGAAAQLATHRWIDGASPLQPLPQARAQHRERLAASPWGAVRPAGQGQARVGTPTTQVLTLEAGCSRIDVIGGQPAGPLSAALWSTSGGQLLAEGRGGQAAALFHCGPRARRALEVSAEVRPGPFAVDLRRDARSPEVLTRHGRAAARLLGWLESTEGPVHASRAAGAEVLALRAERRLSVPFNTPPGRCKRAVVALDGPAVGVEMRLLNVTGAVRAHDRGPALATVRQCAGAGSEVGRLELTVGRGQGQALLLRLEPVTAAATPVPSGGASVPESRGR